MKIFLDANILFSASNTTSALHAFHFELAKRMSLVTSHYALEEACINIAKKRPQWQEGLAKIIKQVKLVTASDHRITIALPDKDKPILAAAIHAKCDLLLTGDKRDFGAYYGKTINGVKIVDYPRLITLLDAAE